MKREKFILLTGAAVLCAALAGYAYGSQADDGRPVETAYHDTCEDLEEDQVTAYADVPIYENTSLYAARTLREMSNMSANIVIAEVVGIGESVVDASANEAVCFEGKEAEWEAWKRQKEEDRENGVIMAYPLNTPVTLRVKAFLKRTEAGQEVEWNEDVGDTSQDQIICYEDGGVTSQYGICPSGGWLEEGMEVLMFLNEWGYSYGGQGKFKIVGDQVVLKNLPYMMDDLDPDKISVVDAAALDPQNRARLGTGNVRVMDLDDFLAQVRALMEEP